MLSIRTMLLTNTGQVLIINNLIGQSGQGQVDVEIYNVEALKKVEDKRVYDMLYNYILSGDY